MNALNLDSINHSIAFIENIINEVAARKRKRYNQNSKPTSILGVCVYEGTFWWKDLRPNAYGKILNRILTTDECYATILGKREYSEGSFNDAEWLAVNLFGLGVAPVDQPKTPKGKQQFYITKEQWLKKAEETLVLLREIANNM